MNFFDLDRLLNSLLFAVFIGFFFTKFATHYPTGAYVTFILHLYILICYMA